MHFSSIQSRVLLILAFTLALAIAHAAEKPVKPLSVTDETLIPKRGANSCLIDSRFNINLNGILGCVVELNAEQPKDAGDASVEPLISFKQKMATGTKTTTEEVHYHALLQKEQTSTVGILQAFSLSMGKKDVIEVRSTERPSVTISYCDLDVDRIVSTFKKLPAEKQAQLGVIIGLSPYVISTAVYSERPNTIGGNYFGVKIGQQWLYKSSEDRNDYYVVAVYAPVSLLLQLAENKASPQSIDLNILLNQQQDDDNTFKTMGVSPTLTPTVSPKRKWYDRKPKAIWRG